MHPERINVNRYESAKKIFDGHLRLWIFPDEIKTDDGQKRIIVTTETTNYAIKVKDIERYWAERYGGE